MKTTTLATIAILILGPIVSPSSTAAQDVHQYVISKLEALTQTSTASPTITGFGFNANVYVASGGLLTSASVTLPTGSTNQSPQALGSDGHGNFHFDGGSSTQQGMDTQFNNGTYGLNITGGSGSYSASLTLTGNAYPAPAPTITNTNWSSGALLIDPSQDFTFTWNSFSNFGAGSSVNLRDDTNTFNFNFDTNATSQFIPAGSFAPNTSYAFSLTFQEDVDTNTSAISGATGYAQYIDGTNFTVQTSPEPSTSMMLAMVGALLFSTTLRKINRAKAISATRRAT